MSQNTVEQSIKLRVSTEEIDETVYQLQAAFMDGRLDESEYERRIAQVIQAKTKDALLDMTKDLVLGVTPLPELQKLNQSGFAILSGFEQKGSFVLPKNYSIKAILGGCSLDLRSAKLQSNITNIKVMAIMGGVQILVPRGIRVEVRGLPIMGGFSNNVVGEGLLATSPLINVSGIAIMGGVEIKTV